LIESSDLDAVDGCQVAINDHTLAAHDENRVRDALDRHKRRAFGLGRSRPAHAASIAAQAKSQIPNNWGFR
jgi:hypothetical protein